MTIVNLALPPDARLSRGAHSSPTVGTCLMELASLMADERFGDRPRCVHPTLATIARTVNDHVGDDTRQRLLALLPAMMSAPAGDPRVGPAIALSCLDTAARLEPGRLLRAHRRRAHHHLRQAERRRPWPVAWFGNVRRQFAVFRAVATATGIAFHHGDEALVSLLSGAVAASSGVRTPPVYAPSPDVDHARPEHVRELVGADAR